MTAADDSRARDDELWDPEARSRALLALPRSQRLELVADLCRRTSIFEELRVGRT